MSWKLTATAVTKSGVWKQSYYSGPDNTGSPDFTHGFICGHAHAVGLSPADLTITMETDD